jgi:hypothetical protein
MPCLLVLLALAMPRVVVACLWLLSSWFKGMFPNPLWPILGFFFLPTTLLWYSAVQNWWGGRWTFWTIAGLVIALCIDVGPASSRRRNREAGDS